MLIIKENNKKRKTRDLFRKVGTIKGAFCPKMDAKKDKTCRGLVVAKEIKTEWKECTVELCKKDLNEPDYYDCVVKHPEPDILGCKVKWALKSTAINKTMKFQQNYLNP